MTSQSREKIEALRAWVYEELEPYFQGKFGTMDTMLEMFIEQLTDKIKPLIDEAKAEVATEAAITFNKMIRAIGTSNISIKTGGRREMMKAVSDFCHKYLSIPKSKDE